MSHRSSLEPMIRASAKYLERQRNRPARLILYFRYRSLSTTF